MLELPPLTPEQVAAHLDPVGNLYLQIAELRAKLTVLVGMVEERDQIIAAYRDTAEGAA